MPVETNLRNLRVLGGLGLTTIVALLIYSAIPKSERHSEDDERDSEPAPLLGEVPPSPENFSPIQVVSRPPLVSGFEILSAQEAEGQIEDDELVLAVEIDGHARAWPLNVMTGPSREVFNDELGGQVIAATW
jgi:hypothetical protein